MNGSTSSKVPENPATAGDVQTLSRRCIVIKVALLRMFRVKNSSSPSGENVALSSFALVETMLASRSFGPWLARLKRNGYHVHVLFLWLESADLAVNRVVARVRLGGHDVPDATVRRRYTRALRNLFGLYLPLADSWQVFDNSRAERPQLVASGRRDGAEQVANAPLWQRITEAYREQP